MAQEKNWSETQIKKKADQVWFILLFANLIFYSAVVVFVIYTIVMEKHIKDGDTQNFEQRKNAFDAVIKAAAAVLLVFSIAKFRWNIAHIKNKDFFKSERMMVLHASIFTLFIVAYICSITSSMVLNSSREPENEEQSYSQRFCQSTIAV